MAECARCSAFTDNPAEGDYPYCNDCHSYFENIRESGIIVQQMPDSEGYRIYVTANKGRNQGGTEKTQVDALARGKHLADKYGLEALFEYQRSGSRWVLEEYLQEHPEIRQDVRERLRRTPEKTDGGFVKRLQNLF